MMRPPPSSTLFPYPALSRSNSGTTPQSAPAGTTFGVALAATVTDSASGLLSGVSVTFTIHPASGAGATFPGAAPTAAVMTDRSEEHTSELQSPCNVVCRLLL